MASSDLFLYRKDRRWQKFKGIDEVVLTGAQKVYSSVTGVDSTDILTITGHTLANGDAVYFQSLSGGSSLAINTTYYVISVSGNTFQLAATTGGSALTLGSNITAGVLIYTQNELFVWSGEYRDTFTPGTATIEFPTTVTISGAPSSDTIQVTGNIVPPQGGTFDTTTDGSDGPKPAMLVGAPQNISTSTSDEYAHTPLRQSALRKTHWRFRQASGSPTYLYAVWMEGDQISNSPPETV